MSSTQQGPDWWIASDGRWYAPELHRDYRPAPPSVEEDDDDAAGWWEASDGKWYPPDQVSASSLPAPPPGEKKSQWGLWILLGIIVLALIGGGIYAALRPKQVSITSGINGTDMSISDLNQSVKASLISHHESGINRVVCVPPDTWGPGKSFTCYAYKASGSESGEYDATVLPNDSSGTPQWNGGYTPS